jgi:hypothetical protein
MVRTFPQLVWSGPLLPSTSGVGLTHHQRVFSSVPGPPRMLIPSHVGRGLSCWPTDKPRPFLIPRKTQKTRSPPVQPLSPLVAYPILCVTFVPSLPPGEHPQVDNPQSGRQGGQQQLCCASSHPRLSAVHNAPLLKRLGTPTLWCNRTRLSYKVRPAKSIGGYLPGAGGGVRASAAAGGRPGTPPPRPLGQRGGRIRRRT